MLIEFISKEHLAENVWTLYFKPERKLRFNEGQFVEISLPLIKSDNRGSKHWFTISSNSDGKLISITTRNFDDKSSLFKQYLFNMKNGQKINCSNAIGDFVLPLDKKIPLTFIAVGVGITPFISMLSHLNIKAEIRDVSLLYHVENPHEYPFKKNLESYHLSSYKVTSDKFDAKYILNFAKNLNNKLYYLAGPERLVESITDDFKNYGLNQSQIITDYFPGYD